MSPLTRCGQVTNAGIDCARALRVAGRIRLTGRRPGFPMKRLAWRDSATATAPPRVRVDRFRGSARRTVHLLGEVRCIKTHHKDKENTVPCLAPEPCPYCADPLWRPRHEFFGPALVRNDTDSIWEPIVAVFTQGGWNKIKATPQGPHRGRVLKVWRRSQGNATGGVLLVEEKARIEPIVPPFDVEPHLLRMWFPHEADLPPAEMPAAVPFTSADVPSRPDRPEPFKLTPEAAALIVEMGRKARGEPEPATLAAAIAEAGKHETPAAVGVITQPAAAAAAAVAASEGSAATEHPGKEMPPPRRSVLSADPEAWAELERKRALKGKQAEDLTAGEAIEVSRILDFVLPSRNGKHAAEGGGK